jgi:hypothetical protein
MTTYLKPQGNDMNRIIALLFNSFLIMGLGSAIAAEPAKEPIGYVMKVIGTATVTTGAESVPAVVGTPVSEGSILRVDPKSSLGVTLKDNTVMSLGAGSEMQIEDYLYAPAKNDLKLTTNLTHGTLNFISGVIAKLRPESVKIKTPTGTIGVRGTHFLVKAD